MTTQQSQEFQSCIIYGIEHGLIKPPPVRSSTEQDKEKIRKAALERYYAKSRRYLAEGLTVLGKPRKRTHEHLTGMTPEQKLERRRQQIRDWQHSHPHYSIQGNHHVKQLPIRANS